MCKFFGFYGFAKSDLYEMAFSAGIDLYGIAHVKVDFVPGLKMRVLSILGKFVWTTSFAQCEKTI